MDDVLAFDQQLRFPLYAAGHLLTRFYRPLLNELGLAHPQYLVMLACWQQMPCAVGDLGRRPYLDMGTLTPLLKCLEEQGLVTRTRDPDDQRRVVIELIDVGRALRERVAKVPEVLVCKIPLELDEVGATRDVPRKLLDALATVDDHERVHPPLPPI